MFFVIFKYVIPIMMDSGLNKLMKIMILYVKIIKIKTKLNNKLLLFWKDINLIMKMLGKRM